jgi:capsular exopolysaccharide synthesis family protein
VLSGVELEAYQTLRSSVELSMPADRRPHLLLLTGALHAEGKTTATARLGRALTQAGHRVLLVSADLRVPRLHEMFGLQLGAGLSDILAVLDWDASTFDDELLERATHVVVAQGQGKGRRGELHVITSGTKAKDPGRLIAGPAMKAFIEHVRGLDYDYVLIDAPPLLGIADSQALARHVDDILLVNRLDRLTLETVDELRDVIDRLHLRPLGIVVIGARGEISPYYMQRRPALFEEDEAQAAS